MNQSEHPLQTLSTSAAPLPGASLRDQAPLIPMLKLVSSRLACAAALLLSFAGSAMAYPPAPFYTVYGDVRDETGTLLPSGGAVVVFSYKGKEFARVPVASVEGADYSYEFRMRIDMGVAGTSAYNSLVVASGADYTIAVEAGGVSYLPIEIAAAPPKVGAAADRRRLDLTLGVDSDKDGLPDAWEQSLLYRLGLNTKDLSKITPDGILEADGLTNLQKYLAGTYSGDTAQSFYLKLGTITDTDVSVDFYTLTNKTYTIERSTDLTTWVPVKFTIGASATLDFYTAAAVGVVSARIPWVVGDVQTYYRLKVR